MFVCIIRVLTIFRKKHDLQKSLCLLKEKHEGIRATNYMKFFIA